MEERCWAVKLPTHTPLRVTFSQLLFPSSRRYTQYLIKKLRWKCDFTHDKGNCRSNSSSSFFTCLKAFYFSKEINFFKRSVIIKSRQSKSLPNTQGSAKTGMYYVWGWSYLLFKSQISRELAAILIIHIHSLSVTLYKHV